MIFYKNTDKWGWGWKYWRPWGLELPADFPFDILSLSLRAGFSFQPHAPPSLSGLSLSSPPHGAINLSQYQRLFLMGSCPGTWVSWIWIWNWVDLWVWSTGSLRVGHDWATSLSLLIFMHWRRKWQPTPVFLPGESQGRGSLVGCQTSMGSHRVGHDWSDLAAAAAAAGYDPDQTGVRRSE